MILEIFFGRSALNSTVCDILCTYYSSVLLYLYVLIEKHSTCIINVIKSNVIRAKCPSP